MRAAFQGKLDCLEHLVAKGANLEATDKVSPHALRAQPPPPLARRPCCPTRPCCSTLTAADRACGAAARLRRTARQAS